MKRGAWIVERDRASEEKSGELRVRGEKCEARRVESEGLRAERGENSTLHSPHSTLLHREETGEWREFDILHSSIYTPLHKRSRTLHPPRALKLHRSYALHAHNLHYAIRYYLRSTLFLALRMSSHTLSSYLAFECATAPFFAIAMTAHTRKTTTMRV